MIPDEQLQISNSDKFTISLEVNSVVESWLTRTVNSSLRRSSDIRNDKSKAVFDFFDFCAKSAEQVLPNDVEEWRWSLKSQRLADGTIYNRISALAQFYEYLRNEVGMIKLIPINPARVSLPKASKPFQSESVKALSREELSKLLEVVGNYAQGKQPIHLRDHALLQFYVATGRRRAEIINLRGNSIEIKDGRFFIKAKVKGGFFLNFELNDETTQNALFDYLAATNRADIFGKDEPLWLRHDKGAESNKKKGLTSHGFARRMEIYALEAGIRHFHIHRLRHTFAKIVSEYSESMAETQEALGHSNIKTTQIYVQRLAVKKDKHSKSIRDALKK
ncbi:MAG TPA: tyrosine-type recombinase/integrase [Pyrinomonadaceae bacterium]|nr:tyrosine-type recombinase/integrase [Pyrinomonadaceae bacterium]